MISKWKTATIVWTWFFNYLWFYMILKVNYYYDVALINTEPIKEIYNINDNKFIKLLYVFVSYYWNTIKSIDNHQFDDYTKIDWKIKLNLMNNGFWRKLRIDVIWYLNIIVALFSIWKYRNRLQITCQCFIERNRERSQPYYYCFPYGRIWEKLQSIFATVSYMEGGSE